jgi:hypothetical protein
VRASRHAPDIDPCAFATNGDTPAIVRAEILERLDGTDCTEERVARAESLC